MKRFLASLTDWVVFLGVGFSLGMSTTVVVYRGRLARTEDAMCATAFRLTRSERDSLALVTARNQCVRLLQDVPPDGAVAVLPVRDSVVAP